MSHGLGSRWRVWRHNGIGFTGLLVACAPLLVAPVMVVWWGLTGGSVAPSSVVVVAPTEHTSGTAAAEATSVVTVTSAAVVTVQAATGAPASGIDCVNTTAGAAVYSVAATAVDTTTGKGPFCDTCAAGARIVLPVQRLYLRASGATATLRCGVLSGGATYSFTGGASSSGGGGATWDGGNFSAQARGPTTGSPVYSYQSQPTYGLGLGACTTGELTGECQRLVFAGASSAGNEIIGHLSVSGELRAKDVLYVDAANGDMVNLYNESDVKVGQFDTEAQLALGGGTAGFLGLQWWADYDGVNGTGWWRPSADVWMYNHNGFAAWEHTLNLMPQQDGTQNIGDATHRAAQVATRNLRAETQTWYAADGTTAQASVDNFGRGLFSTFIGWFEDNDGTPTRFERPSANIIRTVRNGQNYTEWNAAGFEPMVDNFLSLSQRLIAWSQAAIMTLWTHNVCWRDDFDGSRTCMERPSADLIRFVVNNSGMYEYWAGGWRPVTDLFVDIGEATRRVLTAYIANIRSTISTTTPHTHQMPALVVASGGTLPTCNAANVAFVFYVDDTDDASAGMLCVCQANAAGAYANVAVADGVTACIDP